LTLRDTPRLKILVPVVRFRPGLPTIQQQSKNATRRWRSRFYSSNPLHLSISGKTGRSVEKQVEQHQNNGRDTHNPREEIFTHDVLLSKVGSDDGFIMPLTRGLICSLHHSERAPVDLPVALPRGGD
jgi:hypothetical protein